MRFCSFTTEEGIKVGLETASGILSLEKVNQLCGTNFPSSPVEIITQARLDVLKQVVDGIALRKSITMEKVRFSAPYLNPPKILGIGLNYREHAQDLRVGVPSEPASFIKPATTIIGHGDGIILPKQSRSVTAEAELGVIIGRRCKDISVEEAESVIFGFTTVIDVTAEDILYKNPRFLTRAKSFDTFFSFGPWIVTPDEVPNISELRISTLLNGVVKASNTIANMLFSPYQLISFHSKVMTFQPGDIISTGTPGCVHIESGDTVGCEIDGIGILENHVS